MSETDIQSKVLEILGDGSHGILIDDLLSGIGVTGADVRRAIVAVDAMWVAGKIIVTDAPGSTVGEGAATIYPVAD